MNFSSILSEIEKLDPEVYERTSQRRDILKNWSRKVALAAVPFALGSMFKKAYGKGTATILDVLNYALSLEYLEAEFYRKGMDERTFSFPSEMITQQIDTIHKHEQKHVAFLTQAIIGAGGTPVGKAQYDFTGGGGSMAGPFSGVFNNYSTFLSVAQVLEDTGVRAYKGAAPDLMSDNDTLTAALNIHSVEARHASHIRQLRRAYTPSLNVKPWITNNESNITQAAAAPHYAGEENASQASLNIIGIGGQAISAEDATEAFDEPLSMAQVGLLLSNVFMY